MSAPTTALPARARRGFNLREALVALQQPVLAFVTAFLVGSVIIAVTDLGVLATFSDTVSRLAALSTR